MKFNESVKEGRLAHIMHCSHFLPGKHTQKMWTKRFMARSVYLHLLTSANLFFFSPYMLKILSNINIRSKDFRLITGLPNKSQVMLMLAVFMSSAMSQTDCTGEVRSAVTLTQIQLTSCGTKKEGRLSPDPSRYFDIYLTLTLKWAGQLQWERRWPYHPVSSVSSRNPMTQPRGLWLVASLTATPTLNCNSLSLPIHLRHP